MSTGSEGGGSLAAITPEPSDEEAAAIAAALVTFSGGASADPNHDAVPRWRWSGRWWSKPAVARRDRPW